MRSVRQGWQLLQQASAQKLKRRVISPPRQAIMALNEVEELLLAGHFERAALRCEGLLRSVSDYIQPPGSTCLVLACQAYVYAGR